VASLKIRQIGKDRPHKGHKQKTMIAEEFLKLPAFIEFEGITFQLQLINDGNTELRLVYDVDALADYCNHKTHWDQFGYWLNPFINPNQVYPCGFLYLVEGIMTDDDLIKAIEQTNVFLRTNHLMPRLPGIAKGKIEIKKGFDDPLDDFKDYM